MNAYSSHVQCRCAKSRHEARRVVLTGGPGAGKTAVLEIIKKNFCEHVVVLPEAAGIIFGGGFWRGDTLPAKTAAQRAIYYVQRELENMTEEEGQAAVTLCDRGTLDGLAYWPDDASPLFEQLKTNQETELSRYAAVIHLRTPGLGEGYNHQNRLRVESAAEAHERDKLIEKAWAGHPRRFFVESTSSFLEKITKTLELIRQEIPECCRTHSIEGHAKNHV